MTNQAPVPEDLPSMYVDVIQRLAIAQARHQATQALLVATVSALMESNPAGGALIEDRALRAGEILADQAAEPFAGVLRSELEAMLASIRAGYGIASPKGR